MTDDTVISFPQPGQIDDPLTDVLRRGARGLLRRLNGNNQLPKVIEGVRFRDGIEAARPQRTPTKPPPPDPPVTQNRP